MTICFKLLYKFYMFIPLTEYEVIVNYLMGSRSIKDMINSYASLIEGKAVILGLQEDGGRTKFKEIQ